MGGSIEVFTSQDDWFTSQDEYKPDQFNYANVRKAAYRGNETIFLSDSVTIDNVGL